MTTGCLNTRGCSVSIDMVQRQQQTKQQCTLVSSVRQQFEQDPSRFLKSRWAQVSTTDLPSHLVMFADVMPAVSAYITSKHFFLHKSMFNCHMEVDAGKQIVIWKRVSSYPWQQ